MISSYLPSHRWRHRSSNSWSIQCCVRIPKRYVSPGTRKQPRFTSCSSRLATIHFSREQQPPFVSMVQISRLSNDEERTLSNVHVDSIENPVSQTDTAVRGAQSEEAVLRTAMLAVAVRCPIVPPSTVNRDLNNHARFILCLLLCILKIKTYEQDKAAADE